MKLENSRAEYVRHSTKASDVCRQLALAGLAVVWIFKTDSADRGVGNLGDKISVPGQLGLAAFLMMVILGFDFLQYAYASLAWGIFNRLRENDPRVAIDTEFTAPPKMNWPTIAFFWAKLAALLAGYAVLLDYLGRRIFH